VSRLPPDCSIIGCDLCLVFFAIIERIKNLYSICRVCFCFHIMSCVACCRLYAHVFVGCRDVCDISFVYRDAAANIVMLNTALVCYCL